MKNPSQWLQIFKRAVRAGREVQKCYQWMFQQAKHPRAKAVCRDLLLMEEMNELLLKRLKNKVLNSL